MISLDAWRAGFGKFVALTETEAETIGASLLAEVSKTSSYLRTKCEAAKLCPSTGRAATAPASCCSSRWATTPRRRRRWRSAA